MNEFERLLEMVERGKDIYYHLTPDNYGPVVEFYPRRPQSAMEDEPDDKRICVSPSLAGCVVAGSFSLTIHEKLYVYATRAKAKPVSSKDVFDADVTEEHWITRPAVFVLAGELELPRDISSDVNHYMGMVDMPYQAPSEDEDGDEYSDSYVNHMAAKDEAQDGLRSLEEGIHQTAREKLSEIIPRVKDMPGQGLFYFAEKEVVRDKEDAREEKPGFIFVDGKWKNESALAEADESDESDGVAIPKVKAPGNFHQVVSHKRDEDE